MSASKGHPFRRTAGVCLVALAGTMATLVAPGFAGAEEEFVAGSGRGRASIVRVGPSAGQLSLAPTVGVSLADFIGTLGRGESLIFDYAALDTTINGSAPDLKRQFPPLRVESRDPGSEAGVRWEPKPGLVETAQALTTPVGRSSVAIEGFNIPGVIEVTGGKARSFSGLYTRTRDGRTELIRAAGGTVDIPRIAIGGTALVLHDLRWEAAQITNENDDETPEAIGGFTVGRVVSGGVTQGEGLTHEQLDQVFGPLNEQLLSQLGFVVQSPRFAEKAGVVTISPLRIRAAGDALKPLADPLQEGRSQPSEQFINECQAAESGSAESESSGGGGGAGVPLGRPDPGPRTSAQAASGGSEPDEFREFESNGPDGPDGTPHHEPPGNVGGSDCGVPFLVADLALAPLTGFGQMDFDLGGAFGVTEGAIFEGFDLFGVPKTGGGGFEIPTDTGTGTPSAPTVLGDTTSAPPSTGGGVDTPAPTGQGGTTEVAAPQAFKLTGSRASAAWAVGLVGLGAAIAMAATDYRRLRMRRRAVTPIT